MSETSDPAEAPVAARRGTGRLTTRYLLTCAAIGVAAGIVLLPLTNWATPFAKVFPLVYAPLIGFWLIGSVLALAVLKRPGASIITGLVVGLVNVPSAAGFTVIATMLMIGVALELPFLFTLYRIWKPWLFYIATVGFSALYSVAAAYSFNIASLVIGLQIVFYASMLASAALFTWISLLLARRLEKTGATRGLVRANG